uniref:Phytocyanin domain-containing protein n=1 Tax=Aegilops tauschii subsp. strangulata TaxID=200361 RepID=A0A453FPZ2_AEGTS
QSMPSAMKMAAVTAAVCIAALLSLVHVVTAADYIVGNPTGGWQGKTDYKSWASAQTFLPGDTLSEYHQHARRKLICDCALQFLLTFFCDKTVQHSSTARTTTSLK